MGGFSISLGHVAQGFNDAAQADHERAFRTDQAARESTAKMIDTLISSGAVAQEQIPELIQRRMSIMTEPYKPYAPGKTPPWGKHADLSTLTYAPAKPQGQTVTPPPQVLPGQQGTIQTPPVGPPTSPPNIQMTPTVPPVTMTSPPVTFQPPTPPPSHGLQLLTPQQIAERSAQAQVAQEKALFEAREEQGKKMGLHGTQLAQFASGRGIIYPDNYRSNRVQYTTPDNPAPQFGRQLLTGEVIDMDGNVVDNATPFIPSLLPTTHDTSQSYNAETGTTSTHSTSQKKLGTPAPPPSAQGTGVPARAASVVQAGQQYGAWTVPVRDHKGFSTKGTLVDVADDARKGSAVAQEAWNWANLGIKPGGGAKQTNAVAAYMGTHGLEASLGPSTQARSRAAAAEAALPLITKARQMIAANRQALGVIPGRIAEWERRIGNIDPKLAELYGNLKSIYSLAGTYHGWRALEVANEFEKAFGGLHTNADALLGGLQAQEDAARSILKGGGGQLPPMSEVGAPSAPPSGDEFAAFGGKAHQ